MIIVPFFFSVKKLNTKLNDNSERKSDTKTLKANKHGAFWIEFAKEECHKKNPEIKGSNSRVVDDDRRERSRVTWAKDSFDNKRPRALWRKTWYKVAFETERLWKLEAKPRKRERRGRWRGIEKPKGVDL